MCSHEVIDESVFDFRLGENFQNFARQRLRAFHIVAVFDEDNVVVGGAVIFADLFGERVPFGNQLIFSPSSYPSLKIGIEICEDLWVPNSPSQELSLSGANLILNLSASNETVGKASYRRDLVGMQSAKLIAAYLYCDAGEGESTTDCVYSAHNIIAENGAILSESKPFAFHSAIAEIDVDKLNAENRKTNSFDVSSCPSVYFPLRLSTPENIKRHYARNPFIPEEKEINLDRVNEVMDMQIAGLVGRLKAINCHKVVVGLSGGLDSTLALLVAVEAFKKAQKEGMPEDEAKGGETEVQKVTDKFSKKLEEVVAQKEKEIMTV